MYIDSKKFNFSFFLSNRKKVDNLEAGAIEHGGATKTENGIYSNIPGNNYIKINKANNQISVFVPSTCNTDQETDNSSIIEYAVNYLNSKYNTNNLKFYDTMGSWYSDGLKKVVYDNITIVTLTLNTLTESDILNFVGLANYIKVTMNQEGVSISINSSLAIV